jgi:uncharacterized protein (DUF952 family)
MIFHIAVRAEWDEAARDVGYSPPSLTAEGFIHCSTHEQIIGTANLFYHGRSDLVLLVIDENLLAAPLRYEAPLGKNDVRAALSFPHIYGPLNLNAVLSAEPFPCAADGSFELPSKLRT